MKRVWKNLSVAAALASASMLLAGTAQARDDWDDRGNNDAAIAIGAGVLGLIIGAAIADRDDDRYYDRRYYSSRRYVTVRDRPGRYYYYEGRPNRYYQDRYYDRYYAPYYRERYRSGYDRRDSYDYNRSRYYDNRRDRSYKSSRHDWDRKDRGHDRRKEKGWRGHR